MPQFDVSTFTSQLFWLTFVFAALYFLISRFIVPKAAHALIARANVLAENVNSADEYSNKASVLESQQKENIKAMNVSIEDMNQHALDNLNLYFQSQEVELNKVIHAQRQQSSIKNKQYKKQFLAEQAAPCIQLASSIIQKLTKKKADLELLKQIYERKSK